MKKARGKTKRATIRQSLVNFIEENYSDNDNQVGYLFGLADEYMELFDIVSKLRSDIKKRGVNYEIIDLKGNLTIKKNESITDLNRTVQSMVRLQIQIGIKPQNNQNGGGTDDLL